MKIFDYIMFTNFVFYHDDTGFECTVAATDHTNSDVIFFKFDKPIGKISNNLIFAALMTLVGKNWYKTAIFDLSISKHIYEKATAITSTKIVVKDLNYAEDANKRNTYDQNTLSLSGGIDSNALYFLLQKGNIPFHAVCTNFGNEFSKDIEVCKEKVELTMSTNIRVKTNNYVADQKTWEFMGIAAILSTDYFCTKNILFGLVNQYDRYLRTIFNDDEIKIRRPFNSKFLALANCETHGIYFLTEFQNAIVLLDNVDDADFLQKISDASATIGNRNKFFRKQIFLLAANKYLKKGKINYAKYKFLDPSDKFHKRFVEEVNTRTINDKNIVLILGLKYLGYIPSEFKNQLFDKVANYSFIENVYVKDIPKFYKKYPALTKYLQTLFTICS